MPDVSGPLDRRDGESVGSFVRRVAEHWLFEGADDSRWRKLFICEFYRFRPLDEHLMHCDCGGASINATLFPPTTSWFGQLGPVGPRSGSTIELPLCPYPRLAAMHVLERLHRYSLDLADDALGKAIDDVASWLMGQPRDAASEAIALRALFDLHQHPSDAGWGQAEIEESLGLLMLIAGVSE